MYKRYLGLLGLIILSSVCALNPASARDVDKEPASGACNSVRDFEVDWAALGETVTFRTQIVHKGHDLPSAIYTLIRADGSEIALGEGYRFNEYGPDDPLPKCQDHIDALYAGPLEVPYNERKSRAPNTVTIRDYITGETADTVMSDATCIAVDLAYEQLYEDRPDKSDEAAYEHFWEARRSSSYASAKCRDKRQIQMHFRDTPEILLRLIAINAPLISVSRSGYYTQHMAFDPHTNKIYEVFVWGC